MAPSKKVAVMLLSKRAIEWEPGPELMNRPFGPKSTRPLSQGSLSLSLALSPLSLSLARPPSLSLFSFSPCISASTHHASILPQGYKSHMPVMHPPEGDQSATSGTAHAQPQQIPTCMAMSPTHPCHDHVHPPMACSMSTHPCHPRRGQQKARGLNWGWLDIKRRGRMLAL